MASLAYTREPREGRVPSRASVPADETLIPRETEILFYSLFFFPPPAHSISRFNFFPPFYTLLRREDRGACYLDASPINFCHDFNFVPSLTFSLYLIHPSRPSIHPSSIYVSIVARMFPSSFSLLFIGRLSQWDVVRRSGWYFGCGCDRRQSSIRERDSAARTKIAAAVESVGRGRDGE